MALGKGLSSLISDSTMEELDQAYIPKLEISKLEPNPYQPRIKKDDPELERLANSIKENGIIEPLLVTKTQNGKYQLIAGERRLTAAKLAKKDTVPVIIKEASPQQMLELAVVENIHRKDLNALEEGMAYIQLKEMFGLSDIDISKKVGYSRSAVSNKMRLIALPDKVKQYLVDEKLDEGHARALLGIRDEKTIEVAADKVVNNNLSVRATEELVRRLNAGTPKTEKGRQKIVDDFGQKVENDLRKVYGKKVQLFRTANGGKIVIPFKTDKELEKIYGNMT